MTPVVECKVTTGERLKVWSEIPQRESRAIPACEAKEKAAAQRRERKQAAKARPETSILAVPSYVKFMLQNDTPVQ